MTNVSRGDYIHLSQCYTFLYSKHSLPFVYLLFNKFVYFPLAYFILEGTYLTLKSTRYTIFIAFGIRLKYVHQCVSKSFRIQSQH